MQVYALGRIENEDIEEAVGFKCCCSLDELTALTSIPMTTSHLASTLLRRNLSDYPLRGRESAENLTGNDHLHLATIVVTSFSFVPFFSNVLYTSRRYHRDSTSIPSSISVISFSS